MNRYAFRGKPIDTLDRDEMLQALTQACKHIEELTGPTPAERAARFVHPAFPYENPRTPINVCGSCGFAPTIIDEPDMMAIRCQRANCKANPSAIVTLRAIYGESARADVVDAWNRRQAELRAENHPRTPAETEAMLNHMADVHLTPTKEKK